MSLEEALLSKNWEGLMVACETIELQKMGKTPPPVYCALLAVYLLRRDTNNAKLLWKRIPNEAKKNDDTLCRIWSVGQELWRRNFAEAQKLLVSSWPGHVRLIMEAMADDVQARALQLIARAYSNVSLQTCGEMLGCSSEEAAKRVTELGWSVNSGSVVPLKPSQADSQVLGSDKHMEMLTSYISMLEN